MSLLDELRREIRRAERRGVSHGELARRSGLDKGTISRIVSKRGKRLWVDTAEKLAEGLELRVVLLKPE